MRFQDIRRRGAQSPLDLTAVLWEESTMKLLSPPGIQCEPEPTGVLQSHARLLQKAVQSRPELPSFSHRLVTVVCMGNPLLSVLVQPGAEVCKPLLQTQMLCKSWLKQWVPLLEGEHVHRD